MSDVKNLIKMSTAAKMIDRHNEFRKNLKDEKFKPVQSVQFSLKDIENYLRYIKSLSRLKGIKVSGIRVVNAIYDTKHEASGKPNQHTVLFIPTYRCNGEDVAFDPLYVKDGKPLDLKELLENAAGDTPNDDYDEKDDDNQNKNIAFFSMDLEEGDESSFMNFGKMGEPPVKD